MSNDHAGSLVGVSMINPNIIHRAECRVATDADGHAEYKLMSNFCQTTTPRGLTFVWKPRPHENEQLVEELRRSAE